VGECVCVFVCIEYTSTFTFSFSFEDEEERNSAQRRSYVHDEDSAPPNCLKEDRVRMYVGDSQSCVRTPPARS